MAQLPLLKWLLSGIPELCYPGGVGPAEQFDSASIDELARHVCALLRTLFKLVLAADPQDKQTDQLLDVRHAARSNRLLWMAGIHLDGSAFAAGAAPVAASNSSHGSSNSSGSSSSNWQPPFLQLMGLGFIVSAQGLRRHLQAAGSNSSSSSSSSSSSAADSNRVADQQQQQQQPRNKLHAGSISGKDLAHAVFQCLQYVLWASTQLRQLVLPGEPGTAAAAIEALRGQALMLNGSLQHAMRQLLHSAEAAGARANRKVYVLKMRSQEQEQEQEQGQGQKEGAVSSSLLSELAMPRVLQVERDPAEVAAGRGAFRQEVLVCEVLAELYPGTLEHWQITRAAARQIVSKWELLQQLQAFGEALWSQLPQPHCCNNWGCINVAGVSESKLVREGQQVQQVQAGKVGAWHAPACLCSGTWPECMTMSLKGLCIVVFHQICIERVHDDESI
jgi:hypothetical protein